MEGKRWKDGRVALYCTCFNDQVGVPPIALCGATDYSCLCQLYVRLSGALWLPWPVIPSSSSDRQADLLLMACSLCPAVTFTPFNSPLLAQQCLWAFRDYLNGEKKLNSTCLLGYMCVCVCFNLEPDRSKCIADANSERAREERRGGYFYKFIVIFWRCIQWNSNGCLHISYGRFQDVWQLAITVTQVTCCSWKISSDCILPHLNLTWLLTTLVLSLIMQLTVLFLRLIHYGDIASFLSCDLQGL